MEWKAQKLSSRQSRMGDHLRRSSKETKSKFFWIYKDVEHRMQRNSCCAAGMLRYDLITPNVIISPAAYRVYRVSACVSILLFIWLCVTLYDGSAPLIIASLRSPFLFISALAAANTLVGMEFFLFRFDTSHPLKQVFWFCVLLLPLLGAPAYCFLVYSRSDVFKPRAEQAHGASA